MKHKTNKKGEAGMLGILLAGAILLIVVTVTFGLGGQILTDLGAGAANTTAIHNATIRYGARTMTEMSSYLPTIGLVLVIAVILGILMTYLYGKFVRGNE